MGLTASLGRLTGVGLPRGNEGERPTDVKTKIDYRRLDDESIMRLVQAGDAKGLDLFTSVTASSLELQGCAFFATRAKPMTWSRMCFCISTRKIDYSTGTKAHCAPG